jgi:hypothetical protein
MGVVWERPDSGRAELALGGCRGPRRHRRCTQMGEPMPGTTNRSASSKCTNETRMRRDHLRNRAELAVRALSPRRFGFRICIFFFSLFIQARHRLAAFQHLPLAPNVFFFFFFSFTILSLPQKLGPHPQSPLVFSNAVLMPAPEKPVAPRKNSPTARAGAPPSRSGRPGEAECVGNRRK